MPNQKPIQTQVMQAICILIGLAFVAGLTLSLLGKVEVDTGGDVWRLGVYSSANTGPAYHNPLFVLIGACLLIAALLQPFVLYLLKGRLRILALPWMVGFIIAMIGMVIISFWLPSTSDDPLLTSLQPVIVNRILLYAVGVSVGYALVWRAISKAKQKSET
jgi:hypothetical protein